MLETMKKIFILFLSLTAISFSCEENKFETFPVDFELRLLNEQEIPTTEFSVREILIFNFLIANNSTETILFLDIKEREDFMRIFKISEQSENQDKYIDLGKPYQNMFCEYVLGYNIEPQDTLKLQIPWQPDSTDIYTTRQFCNVKNGSDLDVGSYVTGFKSAFIFSIKGEQIITPEQKFEIEFKVK